MTLLAPAGLFLLLLLPIIVAIHLWRIRHRRYTLSSTLLWSRVLTETPLRRPRHLPTRYLLLLLQLAALACGAIALARPAWTATGPHRHLVVAVDTSLAMSATDARPSRLARATTAVQGLINTLRFGDTITLVDAGTQPRVLVTSGDRTVLRRALDRIVQGYGPSSLDDDIPLLGGLLASYGAHVAGYVYTSLGTPPQTLSLLRHALPAMHIQTLGTSADDRGVSGVTVSCPGSSTHRCEAFARLVNTASHAAPTRVTVDVDGQEATQQIVLPPQSTTPIRLSLGDRARLVQVRVDGRDPMPADDAAWAVVPLPVHRTVLLVSDDPTSPVEQALHAIPNLTVKTITSDAYSDAAAARADLTVLDNPPSSLVDTVPGNLLIVDPPGGSALLPSLGTMNAPPALATARDDPLLRGVDLSSLVISSATRIRLPAWARVDIMSDRGPLLVSGITGGRRVAALLFDPRGSAGANASNLATLLAFPALLNNAIQTLAPAGPLTAPAGEMVPLPLVRQEQPQLRTANGPVRTLAASGDMAVLPALRPGLYGVTGGAGGTAGTIAVNPPVPGDQTADGQTTAPAAAPVLPGNGPATLSSPLAAIPWDAWAIVALLALALLSGEWWYYTRRT